MSLISPNPWGPTSTPVAMKPTAGGRRRRWKMTRTASEAPAIRSRSRRAPSSWLMTRPATELRSGQLLVQERHALGAAEVRRERELLVGRVHLIVVEPEPDQDAGQPMRPLEGRHHRDRSAFTHHRRRL